MNIEKVLGWMVVMLAVAAAAIFGQTGSPESVKIGTLTWTKQNLNVEAPGSWCYGNKPENCSKYGRLYTWEAAKKVCLGMGGKWRLPTAEDWKGLVNYAGGGYETGKKLKPKNGWSRCDSDGDFCVNNADSHGTYHGTDEYGFSAMPGGYRAPNGSFGNAGSQGYFWSAKEFDAVSAYRWDVSYNDGVGDGYPGKGHGFSVRCVASKP